MTLREYARLVASRSWLIILVVLAAVALATAWTFGQTEIYEAETEVLVQARGGDGLFAAGPASLDERAIQTEIQIIEGAPVRSRVGTELAIADPPEPEASAVGDTDVISIAVRDPSPVRAQELADAFATAYIDLRREQAVDELLAAGAEVQVAIDEIETQLAGLDADDPRRSTLLSQLANFENTLDELRVDTALRTGGASIIKPAELPIEPVEPTPARTISFAAVFGLLVGLTLVFVRNYFDNRVRSSEDVERITDEVVVASIPDDRVPDHRPHSVSQPDHPAVEAYRNLATNVQFLGVDTPLCVVQVTSSLAGEGKTTTATNLAVVLAESGHRVALVDADLRRPRVHEMFNVSQSPGLTDLLLADLDYGVNHVVKIEGGSSTVDIVPSGVVPPNPGRLLGGARMSDMIDKLRTEYDYVIVDSAPLLPVSDSLALGASVDGVLIVAQSGRVTEDELRETVTRWRRLPAPILGIVLNGVRRSRRRTYAYSGYDAASTNR